MIKYFLIFSFVFIVFAIARIFSGEYPKISSVIKVWDKAPHSAFTDLIRFKDMWFLTFREGADHVGEDNGKVRVLTSTDGKNWETAFVFEKEGFDLRDPMLSITPQNKLMINMAGTVYDSNWEYVSRTIFVTTSDNGKDWTALDSIMNNHEWLWRITWHGNKAYGVTYKDEKNGGRTAALYSSDDGKHFEKVTSLLIPGTPSETTLRFEEANMIALVRTSKLAFIGTSLPPYTEWTWNETKEYVGGPNFIILPDKTMWAAGRFIDWENSKKEDFQFLTCLAKMTDNSLSRVLTLPSGGDTSYPGMVFYDNTLWISYYSSHEGKTSIYLAKIILK